MSRYELTITLKPILILVDSNVLSPSLLVELLRLHLLVNRLQQFIRISPLTSPPILTKIDSISTENFNEINQNSQNSEPELCRNARKCLESNDGIVLCEEGVGGTYFVRDSNRQPVADFKPIDEEPGAINNPKKPMKKLLLPPGKGATREVAAYLLDRNLAGVPETCMIFGVQHERLSYVDGNIIPKNGSVQQFVPNIGNSSSLGTSFYSVEDVHNIGILDIRLLNIDRNEENMLVRKQGDLYRLVPIDHTYILPYDLDDVYLGWMYWKQAKVPFCSETLEFIAKISPEKDAEILRDLGISERCIRNMMMSSMILKKGAEAGLTLFKIASMICRKKKSDKSELEILVAQAGDITYDDKTLEFLVGDFIHKIVTSHAMW